MAWKRSFDWTARCLLLALTVGCGDSLARLKGNDETAGLNGTIEYERVELRATTFERVTEVPVREGDSVAAGQIVVLQDSIEAELAIDRARAVVEAAEARLAATVRGPRQERIARARFSSAGAKSRAEESAVDAERQASLFAQQVIGRQVLDQALARRDSDRAALQEAEAQLAELEEGATVEELAEARAALAEARARLDSELRRGGELEIRSPVGGTLDSVLVEVGDRPTVGESVAVVLAGPAYVRFYVPQQLRAETPAGTSVRVRIDGIDTALPASVRWVAREATFTPFFALNERDRRHLSYLAEAELAVDRELPAGFPAQVLLGDD